MTYQDRWAKGKLVEKGDRDCASRYELIKSFCERFSGPFTVCDIGSNMNYFGIRLTEDFPECLVFAFEYNQFGFYADHLMQSRAKRVMFIKHKLTLDDLEIMTKTCHFNVVLALSVLHHVGQDFQQWISALQSLGDHVICEFATSDSRSKRQAEDYAIPEGGRLLGYGDSHIKEDVKRPIIVFSK